MTGVEGRIIFTSNNNEKSAGSNINTRNYQFIMITFITTVLFFNIQDFI